MQNIRNFFIAFGISLVVFFVAGFLLLSNIDFPDTGATGPNNVINNSGDKQDDSSEDELNAEKEIEGSSFTALLACTDSYTRELDSILLVRVNKERKEYIISSLPTYMVLSMDGIEYYLGDLVRDKGVEFFLDKVYAVTGMKIDYYAFLSLEGFVSIIDELGGVTFTVPEDMYFEDYAGEVIVDLKAGTQELDGAKSLELVRYKGYENGDDGRSAVQKEFLLTALDSFLKIENLGKSSDVFFMIKENIDTNFTVEDFIKNISLIFMYEKYDKVEVEYPGVTNKSDDMLRFIPKIDKAINDYRMYR